jgi:hypothetical protein
MADLSKDTFFDKRLVSFIQGILFFHSMTAISGAERIFMEKAADLRQLDKDLEVPLVNLLRDMQNYAPLQEVLFFLLAARELGQTQGAYEALEAVMSEGRVVSGEDLDEILAQSAEMPMAWAVALLGKEESRNTPPRVSTSSIDLNKLRNFR